MISLVQMMWTKEMKGLQLEIMGNLGERSTTKDISARKVYKEFDVKHNEYQKQSGGTSANDVAAEESIGP